MSDSQLTDLNGIVRGYHQGALKAVLLHPSLCVCFAGNSFIARDVIAALRVRKNVPVDIETVTSRLLDVHRDSRGPVDFLVACLQPLRLSRIAEGVIRDGPAEWIGDYGAFDAFQRYRQAAEADSVRFRVSDDRLEETVLRDAMEAVINDPTVPTVDNFLVTVRPTRRGFVYAPYLRVTSERPQPLPRGVSVPIRLGGVPEGAFAYSFLPAKRPGVGAVGIHFVDVRLGLLFYPVRLTEPELFRDVSAPEFIDQVKRRHQISLGSMYLG